MPTPTLSQARQHPPTTHTHTAAKTTKRATTTWQVFATLHFTHFRFASLSPQLPEFLCNFSWDKMLGNYWSKWNYSYATYSILIKTSKTIRQTHCKSKGKSLKRTGRKMEKTKLITERENQMKTCRNKFHCCLKCAGGKPSWETEEMPPTVTQITDGWVGGGANPHWFLYCTFIWLCSHEITHTPCWDKANSHQRYRWSESGRSSGTVAIGNNNQATLTSDR